MFVKYITVSLVSVLGSSVGSVSSYSSGPKIDPRVQNIFGANVSLSADSRTKKSMLSVTGGKNTGKVPSQTCKGRVWFRN